MSDLWCPFAERHLMYRYERTGPMTGGAAKIVHHTTEGDTMHGAESAYLRSGSLPHFTDSYEGGKYRLAQHLPLNQFATALRHPRNERATNTDNVIQIEHVGHAATSSTWPVGYLDEIAVLCRWIELQTGCRPVALAPFRRGVARIPWNVWHSSSGHCGHMHVPFNDHWDPGQMDIDRVLTAGQPVAPTPVAAAPVVDLEDSTMRGTIRIVRTTPAGEKNAGDGWDYWDTGAPVRHCQVSLQGPFPAAKDQGGDGEYWKWLEGVTATCQPRGNAVVTTVMGAPPGREVGVWVTAW